MGRWVVSKILISATQTRGGLFLARRGSKKRLGSCSALVARGEYYFEPASGGSDIVPRIWSRADMTSRLHMHVLGNEAMGGRRIVFVEFKPRRQARSRAGLLRDPSWLTRGYTSSSDPPRISRCVPLTSSSKDLSFHQPNKQAGCILGYCTRELPSVLA